MTTPDIDQLRDEVLTAYRDLIGDLWEPDDAARAEAFAQRMSKQALLLSLAQTQRKRNEYAANLAQLREMIKSEVVIRYMRALERSERGAETLLEKLVSVAVRGLLAGLGLS